MRIELKGIFSPELNEPAVPLDPECCIVSICADVGEKGKEGADQFNCYVVTPKFLTLNSEVRWGRGYLLVPEFSWREVRRMFERLVSSIEASSWEEAAAILSRYLEWEFENYQPYRG